MKPMTKREAKLLVARKTAEILKNQLLRPEYLNTLPTDQDRENVRIAVQDFLLWMELTAMK